MDVRHHIPIDRYFSPLSEEGLRDPYHLSIFGYGTSDMIRWDQLLKEWRVVILGEGKCGKTHEFTQQVHRLNDEGKYAFFIPLELLHENSIDNIFLPKDKQAFKAWKSQERAVAYFFLDALDELKLRQGSFRIAVNRLHDTIGSTRLHRTKVFLSCRPGDWNREIDLSLFNALSIPPSVQVQNEPQEDSEQLFLSVITRKFKAQEDTRKNNFWQNEEDGEDNNDPAPKVLTLRPLNINETKKFALKYNSAHADELIQYFDKYELWQFYQSPMDIISAMDQLIAKGKIGNLEDQVRFGINQKIKEPSEKKPNSLSISDAHEGAGQIALALFLMKKRSILLDRGEVEDSLDIGQVLTDWNRDKQKELLGKPIFTPTGIGAFRFHHRTTQEYLGAKYLQKLKNSGLPVRDLHALLFGEILDEKIIIPSMEPIVAWLALWDDNILKEVKIRKPLLLFQQGLPASMNLDLRADLLRHFVDRYSGSESRGIGISHTELKRVGHKYLGSVVRELWGKAYTGHDTRELFLELIWLTPLRECINLAYDAAHDKALPDWHRIYACFGVMKAGTQEQKFAIASGMLNEKDKWPERIIINVLPKLLPEAISVQDFLILSKSLKEKRRTVHGVGYSVQETVKSDRISREDKVYLRNNFTDTIWKNRTRENRDLKAISRYDHFADAVIIACQETVPERGESPQEWAWSLAVAFSFSDDRISMTTNNKIQSLKVVLEENSFLREAYFWALTKVIEQLEGKKDELFLAIRPTHMPIFGLFREDDQQWLLNALGPNSVNERRGPAYYALTRFFSIRERTDLVAKIEKRVLDRDDLTEDLKRILNPTPRKPDETEIKYEKLKQTHEKEKNKRIQDWKKWRKQVLDAAPDFLLSGDKRESTMLYAHEYTRQGSESNSQLGIWDAKLLANSFSQEFLICYRKELSKYWRQQDVDLWSEQKPENRNKSFYSWALAIAGLKSDAETNGWSDALTEDEVTRAVRISMVELNGFASFIKDLEDSHPKVVERVVGGEIEAQLHIFAKEQCAPILQDLFYHGTSSMKKFAVRIIAEYLSTIELSVSEITQNEIGYMFKLIAKSNIQEHIDTAVQIILRQLDLRDSLDPKNTAFWLSLLARLDLEIACKKLLKLTAVLDTNKKREAAITILATTFGDSLSEEVPSFNTVDDTRRVELLKKMIIRAYQVVNPQDDVCHDGIYTPNQRDKAEDARRYLFESLLENKTRATLLALRDLSTQPEFRI